MSSEDALGGSSYEVDRLIGRATVRNVTIPRAPTRRVRVREQLFVVNDLRASATWMFNPNFGLGFGYNRFRTTVVVDKDAFHGRMCVGYSGAQVFLTGTF